MNSFHPSFLNESGKIQKQVFVDHNVVALNAPDRQLRASFGLN